MESDHTRDITRYAGTAIKPHAVGTGFNRKNKPLRLFTFLITPVLIWGLFTAPLFSEKGGKARTFIINENWLALSKKLWKEGDPTMKRNVKKMVRDAKSLINMPLLAVTQKNFTAPSGDKHDFVAYGTYYWPNPDTKNGLPMVFRDGQINPDAAGDWRRFIDLAYQAELFAVTYYFTGDEIYAQRAALLLRTWFIDKETRMNPNGNYSKIVIGASDGGYSVAGFGYRFRQIYDAAGILESSAAWTAEDKQSLMTWTKDFINWVETDRFAQIEKSANTNHGTFYDMIIAVQSLYIGDSKKAKERLLYFLNKRLDLQYNRDGSQPIEMKRENNFDYHRVNLMIAFDMAQMAESFTGIDIWNYPTPKAPVLRKAIEFLAPFLSGAQPWPFFKKNTYKISDHLRWPLLRRAAVAYKDRNLDIIASGIPTYNNVPIITLTYPNAVIPVSHRDIFLLKLASWCRLYPYYFNPTW